MKIKLVELVYNLIQMFLSVLIEQMLDKILSTHESLKLYIFFNNSNNQQTTQTQRNT